MTQVESVIHLLRTKKRVSIRDVGQYDQTLLYEWRARLVDAKKVFAKEGLSIVHHKHDKEKGETVSDNSWELVRTPIVFNKLDQTEMGAILDGLRYD